MPCSHLRLLSGKAPHKRLQREVIVEVVRCKLAFGQRHRLGLNISAFGISVDQLKDDEKGQADILLYFLAWTMFYLVQGGLFTVPS